jgi:hypothetical protein
MIKKIKHFYPIILIFIMSCGDETDVIPRNRMLISVSYVYSINNTVTEVNIVTSQNPIFLDEVGIVWATKSNPTTEDNRQPRNSINNIKSYIFKLENLKPGTTYYLRAYYVSKGVTTYSSDEIAFTQNYDPDWVHLPSPEIIPGSYMLSSGGTFSGKISVVNYYAVDKTTNIAKVNFFFPDVEQWGLPYFNSFVYRDAPMRYEPFNANFHLGSLDVVLVGGGYNKQFNGNKFFLKNFKIEGLDGYPSYPSYPGSYITTTSFGIEEYPYILENMSKGKLWRFDVTKSQWNELGNIPVAKGAKFISFDIGDRAFILPEPNDWNDNLDSFYEYLPTNNQWKPIAIFKGENRRRGLSFVCDGKLYYGAGQSTKTLKGLRDIWEYDPTTNIWKQFVSYPGSGTLNLVTLVVNKNLYIGFGQQVITNENKGESFTDVGDFWRFTIR